MKRAGLTTAGAGWLLVTGVDVVVEPGFEVDVVVELGLEVVVVVELGLDVDVVVELGLVDVVVWASALPKLVPTKLLSDVAANIPIAQIFIRFLLKMPPALVPAWPVGTRLLYSRQVRTNGECAMTGAPNRR